MVLRIDGSKTTISPDLGRMAIDGDPYPGVADEMEFVGFDPDKPAVQQHDDDIISILKDIRNAIRNPVKLNPFWFERILQLPNVDNSEISVQSTEPFKHIWVARAPRVLNVYAGLGKSLFVGSLSVGESLRVSLPFQSQGVTLDWATAGGNHYVTVVMSSEKLEIEKV
jgi:hypothetical protein